MSRAWCSVIATHRPLSCGEKDPYKHPYIPFLTSFACLRACGPNKRSIGNEIPDKTSPEGIGLSKTISDYIRYHLDPSPVGTKRAVTSAYNGVSANNKTDAYLANLDVAGYNYDFSSFDADHKRVPSRVIVGTETFPAGTAKYWENTWKNDFVIGNFIWTAIDYIG